MNINKASQKPFQKWQSAMRESLWGIEWVFIGFLLCVSGGCQSALSFDGDAAYKHVVAQCEFGPRFIGTEAARETSEYIAQHLQKYGCQPTVPEFDFRGVTLRNVLGRVGKSGKPCVILGTHYDTRRFADSDLDRPTAPVLGANDGASGVAVLLELARCLDRDKLTSEVRFAFFDGEDQGGIQDWPWSVGARYMAEHLDTRPVYVIIVDMIGDANQQIYWEHNSDRPLQQHIWNIAAQLGYAGSFLPDYKYSIIDDHIPFRDRGITAVDLIDFDYPYWHTTEDTPDKVSAQSLARVGRILEELLERSPYRAAKGS